MFCLWTGSCNSCSFLYLEGVLPKSTFFVVLSSGIFGDREDFSAVLVTSCHSLDGKQYSWAIPRGTSFKEDFKSFLPTEETDPEPSFKGDKYYKIPQRSVGLVSAS